MSSRRVKKQIADTEPAGPKRPLTLENFAHDLDAFTPQMNHLGQGLMGVEAKIGKLEEHIMLLNLFGQKEQLRTVIIVLLANLLGADDPVPLAARGSVTDDMWRDWKQKYGSLRTVTKKEFFDDIEAAWGAANEVGLMSNKDGMSGTVMRIEAWNKSVCGEGFAERFTLPKNIVRVE